MKMCISRMPHKMFCYYIKDTEPPPPSPAKQTDEGRTRQTHTDVVDTIDRDAHAQIFFVEPPRNNICVMWKESDKRVGQDAFRKKLNEFINKQINYEYKQNAEPLIMTFCNVNKSVENCSTRYDLKNVYRLHS